jgi:MFS family permease
MSVRRAQMHIFWSSFFGWLLDGFDTTIYAFVLVPALTYLLPASGISVKNLPFWGLTLFAIFLAGWGSSFVMGLMSDRFGRMAILGLSITLYALGTLGSGLADNIPEFAVARFVAGFGLGAEWFLGGTAVAEAFPDAERPKWIGRFHSGYYVGFIVAALGVPFLEPVIGYRAIFYIGVVPAFLLFYIRLKATEPELWLAAKRTLGESLNMRQSLGTILGPRYRRQTLLLALIMVPVITGLYGGTLFVPTAVTYLIGFVSHDVPLFLGLLVLLGIGGADFSVFSLWLPELYPTHARGGGFAIVTTIGRYGGAGLVFAIGALNTSIGLANSLSLTAFFFLIALILLPFAGETRGAKLRPPVEASVAATEVV